MQQSIFSSFQVPCLTSPKIALSKRIEYTLCRALWAFADAWKKLKSYIMEPITHGAVLGKVCETMYTQ